MQLRSRRLPLGEKLPPGFSGHVFYDHTKEYRELCSKYLERLKKDPKYRAGGWEFTPSTDWRGPFPVDATIWWWDEEPETNEWGEVSP